MDIKMDSGPNTSLNQSLGRNALRDLPEQTVYIDSPPELSFGPQARLDLVVERLCRYDDMLGIILEETEQGFALNPEFSTALDSMLLWVQQRPERPICLSEDRRILHGIETAHRCLNEGLSMFYRHPTDGTRPDGVRTYVTNSHLGMIRAGPGNYSFHEALENLSKRHFPTIPGMDVVTGKIVQMSKRVLEEWGEVHRKLNSESD